MIAGLLQFDPVYLDVDSNLNTVESYIKDVSADLLVLPELFATGYFFRSKRDLGSVAESAQSGKTVKRMIEWSRYTGATIVGGFAELSADTNSFYNSAAVTTPNGLVGIYRKVHLFYKEKNLFTPGDLGFPVFDVVDRAGCSYRLGVMICFDWYFPEAARSLALGGADVIAHPSNLVRKDCPRSMPIRALENHVFTLTANRIGTEAVDGESLSFIGQSVACTPAGHELYKFGQDQEGLALVEFDAAESRDRNITSLNNLFQDRRSDAYRLD